VLSPHQEKWLHDMSDIHQPVFVCKSLEQVKNVVKHVQASLRRKVIGLEPDLS